MSNFNYRNSKKFKYGYYDSSSYQPSGSNSQGSSSGQQSGSNNAQGGNNSTGHNNHNPNQSQSQSFYPGNHHPNQRDPYSYNSYSHYNNGYNNFKPKYKRKQGRFDNRSSHYTPSYGSSYTPDESRSYRRNSYDDYRPKPAFELKSLKSRSTSPNKSREDKYRRDGRSDKRDDSRRPSIKEEPVGSSKDKEEGEAKANEVEGSREPNGEEKPNVTEDHKSPDDPKPKENSQSKESTEEKRTPPIIEATVPKEDVHKEVNTQMPDSTKSFSDQSNVKSEESKSGEEPQRQEDTKSAPKPETNVQAGVKDSSKEVEAGKGPESAVTQSLHQPVEIEDSPLTSIPSIPTSSLSSVPSVSEADAKLDNKLNKIIEPLDEEKEEDDHDEQDRYEESAEEDDEEGDDMDVDSDAETVVSDTMPSASNATKLAKELNPADKQLRPYVLKRDASGSSLLQRACKKGNFEEVKSLIERGASANESDFCGFTCLHEAALNGDARVVKYLIEHGADVNKQALPDGDLETPLIDAADNKHLEIVKILLDNGADPRIYNSDGFTALTKIHNQHQDEEGYDEIIQLLEEANAKYLEKADVEKQTFQKSPSPTTIIEDPNDNYFSDLLRKKNHAAMVYKYAAEGVKDLTVQYIVEGGRLDLKPDILILAARNGHLELVDIMLGLVGEYDINLVNNCGLTALLASVGRGHYKVIEFLLERGANPFLRRKQDNLNALEISQRSANFDPKEIELIEQHMKKNPNYSVLSKSITQADLESSDNEPERKRKSTEVEEKKVKKPKHDKVELHKTKSREHKDKPEKPELARLKTKSESEEPLNIKSTVSPLFKAESSGTPPAPQAQSKPQSHITTPVSAVAAASFKNKSPSPPPPPTKEELELRMKKAEEDRIYQEKVEAKRKARRDMFLKSEREKERRRIEEEQKLKEQKKQQELQKKQEDENKLKEIEAETKRIKEEKHAKRLRLMWEQLPPGLKSIKHKDLTKSDVLKYCPIFKFNIDGSDYVLDLHMTLVTGVGMIQISKDLEAVDQLEATAVDKSKLWSLYSSLIGSSEPSQPVPLDQLVMGHEKFQAIVMKFTKADKALELMRQKCPLTYETITETDRFITVDYAHLNAFKAPKPKSEEPPIKLPFVPFAFRNRPDLIKCAQEQTSLW